jgi:uncharacterized caspase-like protein
LDDADREKMLGILSQLRQILGPDDSLLVYYGGHGTLEDETNRAYWLPLDAVIDEAQNWVSDSDIADAIKRLNPRHALIVADSCYAGGFQVRAVPADRRNEGRAQFLNEVNFRRSRAFISSGGKEPVSDGGGGGHSVFAKALLDTLSKEKSAFTATELFAKLQSVVGGNAKQVPQYFPMKEDEGGQFVFIPARNN